MSKPSLARGTRDFGPSVMVKRNFIFDTIKRTFQKFGFQPIETPTIENLSVLMGKYGDEGDQLLFKILNSGDFAKDLSQKDLDEGSKKLTHKISEKGLRYDLTVPFARFVVMNRNDLVMPFKRYQIQPVWRADRPQKGRYREFYQCDADVVGTDSLICEAEIVLMLQEILQNLGIKNFTIKINNRKILSGIAEVIGVKGSEVPLTVAIDKLDKIGKEKVEEELRERGFSEEAIGKLQPIFEIQGNDTQVFEKLRLWLKDSETGLKGIEELEKVWSLVEGFGLTNAQTQLDITLARGLSYYTGAIFEVKANGVQIGSISGGGRYDNLTGTFGMPGLSGVGISLGVDRIFDVMEELNLFPDNQDVTTKVLVTNFDAEAEKYSLPLLKQLRDAGINAEIYPESSKIKKQFDYANRKNIPFVIVVGSDEIQSGELTLKNMELGEQEKLSIDLIIEKLK
ncbi:Histidyl-tRNA synthetase [Emticicia oligotrophica DSM 17448]|uniref:Histidine--tRNA ligase n=1 Tax=Emticicia oligotrophica (strain DSM 17448 / CIP 109782 / MTCC 6937 / GPTSA100-15) TaxID=929562 RepID=A0ABN4ANW1_EMTOG|nr:MULTISPECIES: histidine--tRNA ligase [Emticicia]AFK04063.1 Histidyl-tRNA synthetase [Emticicia oligotrophica DSM 17448]